MINGVWQTRSPLSSFSSTALNPHSQFPLLPYLKHPPYPLSALATMIQILSTLAVVAATAGLVAAAPAEVEARGYGSGHDQKT